jgi:hypothetical protein
MRRVLTASALLLATFPAAAGALPIDRDADRCD